MSSIPVDLRLAKMLVLGAIFKCLDPILSITAILSSKPLFLSPLDKRNEAQRYASSSLTYVPHCPLMACLSLQGACRLFDWQLGPPDGRQSLRGGLANLSLRRSAQLLRGQLPEPIERS